MDFKMLLDANELGVRLEYMGGIPIWEPSPNFRHQKAVDRIRNTIEPPIRSSDGNGGCACIHVPDLYIELPDGSLKRPDISVFCREPEEEDTPVRMVPEAVIEVVSKGYEAKDVELAPPFYLKQGIKDVVVFDPRTLRVLHFRPDGTTEHTSPVEIHFECGCRCTV